MEANETWPLWQREAFAAELRMLVREAVATWPFSSTWQRQALPSQRRDRKASDSWELTQNEILERANAFLVATSYSAPNQSLPPGQLSRYFALTAPRPQPCQLDALLAACPPPPVPQRLYALVGVDPPERAPARYHRDFYTRLLHAGTPKHGGRQAEYAAKWAIALQAREHGRRLYELCCHEDARKYLTLAFSLLTELAPKSQVRAWCAFDLSSCAAYLGDLDETETCLTLAHDVQVDLTKRDPAPEKRFLLYLIDLQHFRLQALRHHGAASKAQLGQQPLRQLEKEANELEQAFTNVIALRQEQEKADPSAFATHDGKDAQAYVLRNRSEMQVWAALAWNRVDKAESTSKIGVLRVGLARGKANQLVEQALRDAHSALARDCEREKPTPGLADSHYAVAYAFQALLIVAPEGRPERAQWDEEMVRSVSDSALTYRILGSPTGAARAYRLTQHPFYPEIALRTPGDILRDRRLAKVKTTQNLVDSVGNLRALKLALALGGAADKKIVAERLEALETGAWPLSAKILDLLAGVDAYDLDVTTLSHVKDLLTPPDRRPWRSASNWLQFCAILERLQLALKHQPGVWPTIVKDLGGQPLVRAWLQDAEGENPRPPADLPPLVRPIDSVGRLLAEKWPGFTTVDLDLLRLLDAARRELQDKERGRDLLTQGIRDDLIQLRTALFVAQGKHDQDEVRALWDQHRIDLFWRRFSLADQGRYDEARQATLFRCQLCAASHPTAVSEIASARAWFADLIIQEQRDRVWVYPSLTPINEETFAWLCRELNDALSRCRDKTQCLVMRLGLLYASVLRSNKREPVAAEQAEQLVLKRYRWAAGHPDGILHGDTSPVDPRAELMVGEIAWRCRQWDCCRRALARAEAALSWCDGDPDWNVTMGHLRFLEARLFADTQAPSEAASAAREAKAIYTRSTSWYYRRLVEEWEGESLALAGAVPGTGTRGVFARALTDDERRELSAVAESQDTFAARRAWIIVLSADKMGAADIAKDPRVAMDQGPVRKVINDFNRRGLAVLCRGRHRRADAEQTRP